MLSLKKDEFNNIIPLLILNNCYDSFWISDEPMFSPMRLYILISIAPIALSNAQYDAHGVCCNHSLHLVVL